MSAKIDVHVLTEDTTTIVAAKGDIDIHTSSRFSAEALQPARTAERYVLDLSSVGFVDSTGIGALVQLRKALVGRGLQFEVVPSRRVRAALTLSSLESTMVLHDSVEAALQDGTPA